MQAKFAKNVYSYSKIQLQIEQYIATITKIIVAKIKNTLCVSKSIWKKNLIKEIGKYSEKCIKTID